MRRGHLPGRARVCARGRATPHARSARDRYYFSDLTRDECVVFVTFDSHPPGGAPHRLYVWSRVRHDFSPRVHCAQRMCPHALSRVECSVLTRFPPVARAHTGFELGRRLRANHALGFQAPSTGAPLSAAGATASPRCHSAAATAPCSRARPWAGWRAAPGELRDSCHGAASAPRRWSPSFAHPFSRAHRTRIAHTAFCFSTPRMQH